MTNNEVKLIKKYCVNALGRKWSEVLSEFEQKRLGDALRWAIEKRVKPSLETLLSEVEIMPDDMPEKPILNETTSEP